MRILNCLPSDGKENDWTYQKAINVNYIEEFKPPDDEVDLRKEWWGINDQKKTGSCVGWAIADSCLRWHLVEKKILLEDKLLSVRFVWMASKEIDELKLRPTSFIEDAPTKIKAGLDILKDYGCVIEDLLPFEKKSSKDYDEIEFYLAASEFKIKNYLSLVSDKDDKISVWKKWLSNNHGPIIIRLEIDKTWNNISIENPYLDNYLIDTAVGGGHAATIVGYNENGFIIRNSWGKTWGDNGYAYASFSYAEQAFTEAYGICF